MVKLALNYVGTKYLTCLSTDTKPTTLESNFIAYETDSNTKWIWDGSNWKVQDIALGAFKKYGVFPFHSTGTGDGILNSLSFSTGLAVLLDNTLNRKYETATTSTTNGNNAGFVGTASFASRDMNPRMYIEFKLGATSGGQRLFLGFQSNTTNAGGSDDPLNALEGFYFGFISTDTVYQIMSNDSSGATVFTAVTAVTTIDTTMHKLWLWGDATNNKFGISIDNNAWQYVTSNIPAATTALVPHVEIETTGTPAKVLNMYNWSVFCDS